VDYRTGSDLGHLDFSESLQLIDFLSSSAPPTGITVHKRVYMALGLPIDARAIQTNRSVKAFISALPFRLADPSMKWAVHLTLQQITIPWSTSDQSGSRGEVVGEVAVLILSTSKREIRGDTNPTPPLENAFDT
jgi:hypothetical protein